jgi:hypothetical protein
VRDADGGYRAYFVQVLTLAPGGRSIARITVFLDDPALFDRFGMPQVRA